MNTPDEIVVDIEETREWLIAHKASTGYSWTQLASLTNIPTGTLSPFSLRQYRGSEENVAKKIFQYRQMLDMQGERRGSTIVEPGYFETPTSERIRNLLVWAQSGRITVVGAGPGVGKTISATRYAQSAQPCWYAVMSPTTQTLNAMLAEVAQAIGHPKGGYARQMSRLICDTIGNRRGLLIIDEAHNLHLDALEEIRSWHDRTGVGISLLGNEELIQRIQHGPRRDAFGRLNSRIAKRLIQTLPLPEDVEAFCDAWGIKDGGMRRMLSQVALTPGSGGLREIRQIVEEANMLAEVDGGGLTLALLREAKDGRATRYIPA